MPDSNLVVDAAEQTSEAGNPIWDSIIVTFTSLWDYSVGCFQYCEDAGISLDFFSVFFWILILLIWIASGFISATISEMKGHGTVPFFFGGLALPIVFPWLILQFLSPKIPISQKKLDLEEEPSIAKKFQYTMSEEELKKEEAMAMEYQEELKKKDEPKLDEAYDRDFFQEQIAIQNQSEMEYIFTLDDDRIVQVSKIIQALDTMVILEIVGAGNKGQTIRVPYAKIKSVDQAG